MKLFISISCYFAFSGIYLTTVCQDQYLNFWVKCHHFNICICPVQSIFYCIAEIYFNFLIYSSLNRDLSSNNFSGSIPGGLLEKSQNGLLTLRFAPVPWISFVHHRWWMYASEYFLHAWFIYFGFLISLQIICMYSRYKFISLAMFILLVLIILVFQPIFYWVLLDKVIL